ASASQKSFHQPLRFLAQRVGLRHVHFPCRHYRPLLSPGTLTMKKFPALAPLLVIVFAADLRADVVPNPLFTDGAVLQQNTSVPVWGTADPGERVTVEFAGQSVSATAAGDGKWMVRLQTPKAVEPFAAITMTISGKNKSTLRNLLVGEVWLCSGQSNMERHL